MRSLAAFVLAALAACSAYPGEGCVGDAPDAPWLAFASNRTGNYEIFVARADGSCARQVTDDPAQDLYPSFGPAGRIAYRSDRNLRVGIRIHDLPTGQDWALEVGTLAATAPAYSPDGTRIAFEARSPGSATSDVFVVPAAGGVPTRLTDDLSDDAGPAWSPDGATVYFVSTRAGPYDVFSVAATGGAAARVTTGSRIVGKPAHRARRGGALLFTHRVGGDDDRGRAARPRNRRRRRGLEPGGLGAGRVAGRQPARPPLVPLRAGGPVDRERGGRLGGGAAHDGRRVGRGPVVRAAGPLR